MEKPKVDLPTEYQDLNLPGVLTIVSKTMDNAKRVEFEREYNQELGAMK